MCPGTGMGASSMTDWTVILPQRIAQASRSSRQHRANRAKPGLMSAAAPTNDIDIEDLANRLTGGDRAALARAITLVESRRADHQATARALLQRLMPRTGAAQRVGVTGVPGAGKSTIIETLGLR